MFKFSNNQNLMKVFSDETSYRNFRSVASARVRGNEPYVYDTEGNQKNLTAGQADQVIRKTFMSVLHLTEDDLKSRKKCKRAQMKYGMDLFEIIEQDIDFYINRGFSESEWFQRLVDQRNVALGDAPEFQAFEDELFVVSDVSGDNHDITMQQLPSGKFYTVPVKAHAVKIGKDIDMILTGRIDYPKMVQTIAKSFVNDVQYKSYDALVSAASLLPGGDVFVKTGALSSAQKDKFDELLENVSAANNSDVAIVGTKSALKKINNFYANAASFADSQKEAIASTGHLGDYEGSTIVEIPQKFKVGSFEKVYDNTKLYILPLSEDKFIKFVDEGETEIKEDSEKGDTQDDFHTYEVQRRYGAGVVLGRAFGEWTIE